MNTLVRHGTRRRQQRPLLTRSWRLEATATGCVVLVEYPPRICISGDEVRAALIICFVFGPLGIVGAGAILFGAWWANDSVTFAIHQHLARGR